MKRFKKLITPILAVALVCGTTICLVSIFSRKTALADMLRMSPEERIQLAETKYDSLKVNPAQDVEVVVSFKSSMNGDDVKAFLNNYTISINSVFQSVKCKNNTFSGAYVDCAGKGFDQILRSYKSEYLASLTNSLEQSQKDLLNMNAQNSNKLNSDDPLAKEKLAEDEHAAQALENYILDLQQAIDQANTGGIVLYGLKLKGPKSEFSKMVGHKAVRAVEILNDQTNDLTPIQP